MYNLIERDWGRGEEELRKKKKGEISLSSLDGEIEPKIPLDGEIRCLNSGSPPPTSPSTIYWWRSPSH